MDYKKLCLLLFVIAYSYALTLKQFNYQMICMVNKERGKRGIPYLKYSSALASAAQKHSKYQYTTRKMSHYEGSSSNSYYSAAKRIKKAGFNYKACGENVAFNQKDIKSVMKAWMKSSGHKANILNKKYTHFGAGVKNRYWTQNFAQAKGSRPKNVKKCP